MHAAYLRKNGHAGRGVVHKLFVRPAVNNGRHVVDGNGGLGDVGGHHHFGDAFGRAGENKALLGGRQLGVKRKDEL